MHLSDLNNQTIVLPQKGKFTCFDQAREFLQLLQYKTYLA